MATARVLSQCVSMTLYSNVEDVNDLNFFEPFNVSHLSNTIDTMGPIWLFNLCLDFVVVHTLTVTCGSFSSWSVAICHACQLGNIHLHIHIVYCYVPYYPLILNIVAYVCSLVN